MLTCLALALSFGILSVSGCGTPNRVNIELRKQNQQLQQQLSQLQHQHQADERIIQGLRDRSGTLPTLPTTRLEELFTTHGIEFGRLTGGADLDPGKPGDEGLAVFVNPVDQTGGKFKAAGTFDFDVFDLDEPQHPLIGHWHFDLEQSKAAWTDALFQYGYTFTLPWQKVVPHHPNLTVKGTFFDELTQTPFTAQKVVRINPPPQPHESKTLPAAGA
jgi:hypothetical protein